MQGSHTHIPGTNHVPRGYIVAAILSLLFMVPLCLVPALALLLLLLLLLYLSPLYRVFTIMYLKQTMLIEYTELQLLSIYTLCYT